MLSSSSSSSLSVMMMRSRAALGAVAIVGMSLLMMTMTVSMPAEAFQSLAVVVPCRSSSPATATATTAKAAWQRPAGATFTALRMSGAEAEGQAADADADAEEEEQTEEVVEETQADAEMVDEEEDEAAAAAAQEEEQQEVDPEVVALKDEIAKLEATVKDKRNTLRYTQDQIDEYSKSGYARKVAEMENMRRVRNNLNSSSRSSAAANVLASFLPIYDRLQELKTNYADDEFGSKLGGLSMSPTFSDLGVASYRASPGDEFDDYRMTAVEYVPSNDVPKDKLIQVLGDGMELEGNVLRPAPCIVSLGPEEGEEEEEEAAPAEEEVPASEEEEEEEAAANQE